MSEKISSINIKNNKYPPKLILFLSVDIQNSTLLKQKHVTNIGKWYKFFHNFFKQFPVYYKASLIDNKGALENPKNSSEIHINIWKSLGDELIFKFEINHRSEISWYILSFKKPLKNIEKRC